MRTSDNPEMTIFFTPPKPGELPQFSAEPEPLEVDPGEHLILMNLVTLNPENPATPATFAPRAIDWCDKDGFLRVCPQAFSMTFSPYQLQLQDLNLAGCHGAFKFIVYVKYEGFTYASPDPTIINKQPGGGITISFEASRLGRRNH